MSLMLVGGSSFFFFPGITTAPRFYFSGYNPTGVRALEILATFAVRRALLGIARVTLGHDLHRRVFVRGGWSSIDVESTDSLLPIDIGRGEDGAFRSVLQEHHAFPAPGSLRITNEFGVEVEGRLLGHLLVQSIGLLRLLSSETSLGETSPRQKN